MARFDLNGGAKFFETYVPARLLPTVGRRLDAAQLACLRTCVIESNVDTGTMRGGWDVSAGQIEVDEPSPDSSGSATISAAIGKVASFQGSVVDRFVANPVEYSRYQNDGTERVPARNMTGKGIMAAVDAFENFDDREFENL